MIANFVLFSLLPGTRSAFLEASLENSRGSVNGKGCVATSFFGDPTNPDIAYVFEVFVDKAAFEAHHEQPYYKAWIAATEPLQAKPYQLLQSNAFPGPESFEYLRLAVASMSGQ